MQKGTMAGKKGGVIVFVHPLSIYHKHAKGTRGVKEMVGFGSTFSIQNEVREV